MEDEPFLFSGRRPLEAGTSQNLVARSSISGP